jgi:hypothetical protein
MVWRTRIATLVSAVARAVDRDAGRPELMLGGTAAAKVAPAVLDEFGIRAAKPRHRNLAAGMKNGAEIVPAALVAGEAPALDNLGAGQFIGGIHADFLWIDL